MLIGDCEGECGVYNVINGAKLKQLTSHHSEVINIFHIAELNYIISCSLDGIVNIHNDININES